MMYSQRKKSRHPRTMATSSKVGAATYDYILDLWKNKKDTKNYTRILDGIRFGRKQADAANCGCMEYPSSHSDLIALLCERSRLS